MDPVREVRKRRTTRLALTAVFSVVLFSACGRSSRIAAPIEPLPTPLNPAPDAQAAQNLDPIAARRAEVRRALELFEAKKYQEAIPALNIAATSDPLIAPYLQLRLIDAYVALDQPSHAISAASSIIANAPSSSAATIARLELPALYAYAHDDGNVQAAMQQVAAIAVDPLTEPKFVLLATQLARAGRIDLANSIRLRLLEDNADGRYTEDVYSELINSNPSPIEALSTENATALAASLAKANHYDQALDLLQRIGTRPDAPNKNIYRTVRFRALFNSRNYSQLLDESTPEQLDPTLQLLRARAAWRLGKSEEFLAGLQRIEKKYPNSREAVDAKVFRAKFYVTDEVDYAKSVANLEAAIKAGASGNDGEHLWTLGYTYVLWGHYDDALSIFDRYVRTYPDGDYRTNVLFWTGKIYDRLGRTAERNAALRQLISEYPYNYYAYRARELMGEPPPALTTSVGAPMMFPDLSAELAKVNAPQLEAVRELIALGMHRDATLEMKTLAAQYRGNAGIDFMLADVYANGGEAFEAINILQRSFRAFIRHGGVNIPLRLWQILYPLNYWDAIRAEAQKRNIDPYLVASIIRQESGFEPTVVSNAGAVGLMQIMPGELARITNDAGLSMIDRKQLFDPVTNIAVGAAEYSQKLAAMNGNHILAIASYNAGTDAVGRWLAQTPIADGDSDIFVDSIPYAETRLYVKSVTRNRFEYRRVYESSTAVSEVSSSRSGDSHR